MRRLGAEKKFFLIRDIDDATRAGAPVEILSIRGPEVSRSRLGSVLVHAQSPTPHARPLPEYKFRQVLCAVRPDYHIPQSFRSGSLGSPKHYRMRCRRLPDPRPTPRDVQEPICPRKK